MDAGGDRADAGGGSPDGGVDAGLSIDAGTDAGPIETTGMTCQPCRVDADCVSSHYCAMIGTGGRVCLPACNIDLPDCPDRFGCVTSFSDTIPEPVCAPVGERCCVDGDGDLYGDGVGCLGLDCDDADPDTNGAATEACDGFDDDCNGTVDDGDVPTMCPRGVHVAGTGCAEGACVIVECEPAFDDCDGDASNGCETPLTTETSCGACGVVCDPANATPDCSGGTCRVATCDPGFADCNMEPEDGCETPLDTTSDCGSCGRACSPANALGDCSSGACEVGSCSPNYGDCDGSPVNGCETLLTTNANCGACGTPCAPSGGLGDCSTGTCRLTTCVTPGVADCDMLVSNGCETSTRTITDCGGCDVACGFTNGTGDCSSGTCNLASCATGFGNCDGIAGNGCEQRLNTITYCGSCGSACTIANGTGDCSSGTCAVASCNAGFADCDGLASNGCEQPLNTLTNCGRCGRACSLANAGESCSTGVCEITTCSTGFGDCDGVDSNGCETSLSTLTDCGACGVICDRANASESCSTRTCTLGTCSVGYSNCDSNSTNGCELRHATAPSTCAGGEDVGTYGGDRSCGFVCGSNTDWALFASRTGTTSRWFKARVSENSDCSTDVEHQIRLTSPAGANYNLYVYRPCGTLVGSATATSGVDTVTVSEGESTGSDDSFDYWVEVRWVSGSTCSTWSVEFYGHNC
jgi:hypothetical protein